MFRISPTGRIASANSTVVNLFAAIGVPIIDFDVIARDVVAPCSAGLAASDLPATGGGRRRANTCFRNTA